MLARVAIVSLALAAPAFAQPQVPFRCPSVGTVAEFSTGVKLTSQGADPADPVVCLLRIESPTGTREARLLYAFWTLPLPHRGAEPAARAGFAALFPATIGKSTTYELFLPRESGGDDPYRETWRVLRIEPVTVRAGSFTAMVMERVQEGGGGNTFRGSWTRWLDLESRVIVKQTFSLSRGRMGGTQDWEAVRVEVPTPPPTPAPATPQRPQRAPPRG